MSYRYLLFPALLFPALASAQLPNVLVDNFASDGECTIIINPVNPQNLLGATNPDVIYRSSDGGATWTETNLSPFASTSLIGDVALAADHNGMYYYQSLDNQLLFRQLTSTDYGQTWGNETVFGDVGWTEDKNWLTCDRSPISPYQGRVYCAWTRRSNGPGDPGYIFVNHTPDGGQTWVPRDTLDADLSNPPIPPIGTGLACNAIGEIGITWGGGSPNHIHFIKSADGGVTWPASPVIVDNNVQPANDYYAGISHAISFSAQFTSFAIDNSGGPYSSNMYCVWDDVRNGPENADIFLARSTDGGVTWTTQRINDDTTTRNQVVPTVAVDPTTGWVYVSYLDARLNKDTYDDTLHYYCAWSSDGGQTFQTVRVSQQPSTLTWIHSDYMGMDAYGGKVHFLWVGGTSSQQAWTAAANQALLLSLKDEQPVSPSLLLYPAMPNPSIDFTTFDFQLSENAPVTLTIMDLEGRVVAQPLNAVRYGQGRHQVKVEQQAYGLSAGIYIATVMTPYGQASRKFVVAN